MNTAMPSAEQGQRLVPRLFLSLIAALALIAGPLAALPASAVAGVTVSGTVTAPTGDTPVSNSDVELQLNEAAVGDPADWQTVTSTEADGDGFYTFTDVLAGDYRIRSGGPQLDGAIYPYGYGETEGVAVDADDVADLDLTLTLGGSITGTTSDDDTDGTLEGVRVLAHRMEGTTFNQVSERETYADENGDYTVTGLRSGTYRLEFQADNYVTEYYDNVTDASNDVNTEGIEDVVVTAPDTATVNNAALTPSGTIAGTVVDEGDNALDDISVTAYQLIDSGDGPVWTSVLSTNTYDGNGYSFSLPIGYYRIGFSDDNNHNFLTEYYDDQAAVDSPGATTLTVNQGLPTNANAVLAPAGHITGSLTAEERDSFFGCVAAYPEIDGEYDYAAGPVATANSGFDDSSAYDLGGLPTGTYKVEFSDCGDNSVATEYYNDQADFADAEGVDVTAGTTTPAIDAVLAEAPTDGTISGTVTDDDTTNALAGIDVLVEENVVDGVDSYWRYADETTTAADGTYAVDVFGGSDYRVRFKARDGLHFTEFNGDVTDEDLTTGVAVVAGTTETVDASLAASSAITGTLTSPVNPFTCVTAFNVNDLTQANPYPGDANIEAGTYVIGGLPAGDYKVRFDCGPQSGGPSISAVQNWYLNKTSFSEASPVVGVVGAASALQPVVTTPPVVVPPAPPAVVKVAPSVKVSVKAGKKKATLTITVRASGVTPTGKVSVKVGKKTYRVTLKNGKAKITVKKLKKGRISFKVVYSGDSKVLAKTVKTKKVKIS